jgi:two-component system cell cycle response regulator
MLGNSQPTFLLASCAPALLEAIEPVLRESGATVKVVVSTEIALAALQAPHAPDLVLLDEHLPGMEGISFLVQARAGRCGRIPIVLISDSVTQEWVDRLAEGVIDDLLLQGSPSPYWRLRLDLVLRTHYKTRELESLRETASMSTQTDPLTGVYNRTTLLSMLFRETDRVQRMNTSLCMLLFDIDDFGHWNDRLGTIACDDLLVQVVGRVTRLLRSYDMFGRVGKDEFLIALPGCSADNAVMLAERMRLEVFSAPFHVAGRGVRLSACFGIAASRGRSPVVVLRESEQSLQLAKAAGPESIQCSGDCPKPMAPPVAFLSPSSGDDLLAW